MGNQWVINWLVIDCWRWSMGNRYSLSITRRLFIDTIDYSSITYWLLYYDSYLLRFSGIFLYYNWLSSCYKSLCEWFATIIIGKEELYISMNWLNGESNWIHRNPRLVSSLLQCIGHPWEKRNGRWTVELPNRKCTEGRVAISLSWLSESGKYTCKF